MNLALAAVSNLKSSLVRGSLLLLALLLLAPWAWGEANILLNGELNEGTGSTPSDWHTESLLRDASTFSWVRKPGDPGGLRIAMARPGFARWSQEVRLKPGWYLLSGEMRIEGNSRQTGGAMIGVYVNGRSFGLSQDFDVSSNWVTGSLYFKVGDPGSSIEIVCQLEGASGTVFFRHLRLTAASEPPLTARKVDLGSVFQERALIEKRSIPEPFEKPTGTLWTFPVTMLVFAALALSGWRILRSPKGAEPHQSSRR
ncbi:MAG: hypothetical protein ACLQDV_15515 [Candidatus Binataceae bacterium]